MASDEELKQVITARLESFCRERGYVLSENREPLVNDLVQMHKLLGDYYCPCQVDNTAETVCVCDAVRNGLVEAEEACFCYLILKKDALS